MTKIDPPKFLFFDRNHDVAEPIIAPPIITIS
jgi:hypothetical protein